MESGKELIILPSLMSVKSSNHCHFLSVLRFTTLSTILMGVGITIIVTCIAEYAKGRIE